MIGTAKPLKCEEHPAWWRLNETAGCIHPDHGMFPALVTDLVYARPGSVAEREGLAT